MLLSALNQRGHLEAHTPRDPERRHNPAAAFGRLAVGGISRDNSLQIRKLFGKGRRPAVPRGHGLRQRVNLSAQLSNLGPIRQSLGKLTGHLLLQLAPRHGHELLLTAAELLVGGWLEALGWCWLWTAGPLSSSSSLVGGNRRLDGPERGAAFAP